MLSDTAEKLGFRTLGVKLSKQKLLEAPLPCILHWNKGHYVVLYKIKKGVFYISDPAIGLISYTEAEFLKFWIGNNATSDTEEGIALLLEPTPKFYENEFDKEDKTTGSFSGLWAYVLAYKAFMWQLIIGLLAGSLLQLIFPFLTQSIVDVGIHTKTCILYTSFFLHNCFCLLAKQLSSSSAVGYCCTSRHASTFRSFPIFLSNS